jgi:hypothetical protein
METVPFAMQPCTPRRVGANVSEPADCRTSSSQHGSLLLSVLIAGAIVVGPSGAAAFGQETASESLAMPPTLHVRLHLKAPAKDLSLPRVADEIRAIWAPCLKVVVIVGEETCSTCSDVVRVSIDDVPPAPSSDALGWIDFENGEPTREITVSLRQMRRLLRDARWMDRRIADTPKLWTEFFARSVGRAIAHEIGHYVLRSASHHTSGLMRTGLNPNDLMQPKRDRFRLTLR